MIKGLKDCHEKSYNPLIRKIMVQTMENNLPKGWIETNLDELQTNVIGGDWGIAEDEHKEDYVLCKVIRGTDFRYWDDERTKRAAIRKIKKSSLEKRQLDLGDIVIEVSGGGPDQPVGRTIIIDKKTLDNEKFPLTCSNFFRKVSLSKLINPFYINYHIKYAYGQGAFNDIQTHTTNLRNLRVDEYLKSPIPLPPLPEQQRIVEKLDALMARISNSKARLEKIPALLKNFRQSVLAAAVSGELTKEWRENNKDIQEAKTKIKKKERRNVLDDKVDDYDLYDLPIKWNWKTISDVSDVKGGKRVPKGHKLVSYDTGLPYIKAGDLKKGTVLKDKLEYLLPETQKLIKRYIVSKGDAYITNVGAKIGDAGIIPDDLDGANLTENALKMCNLEGVINLYLSIWLQSPIAQGFIQKTILSAAQGKLALGRVEVFPIPLPPIEEQEEIVRKVEELFHFADSIEARYQKAKAWFDKLPQAILAKAFRGELVPQNPTDEPASVLLERIEEEKKRVVDEKPKKRNRIPISKTKIIMASLIEIIKEAGGKIEPKELWEKSDFQKDIDAFYAALKEEIEKKKTIKQNADKTLSLS